MRVRVASVGGARMWISRWWARSTLERNIQWWGWRHLLLGIVIFVRRVSKKVDSIMKNRSIELGFCLIVNGAKREGSRVSRGGWPTGMTDLPLPPYLFICCPPTPPPLASSSPQWGGGVSTTPWGVGSGGGQACGSRWGGSGLLVVTREDPTRGRICDTECFLPGLPPYVCNPHRRGFGWLWKDISGDGSPVGW